MDFLQKKFSHVIPPTLRPHDCGVEEDKKKQILKNLVPLMPTTRRLFWSLLLVRNLNEYEE